MSGDSYFEKLNLIRLLLVSRALAQAIGIMIQNNRDKPMECDEIIADHEVCRTLSLLKNRAP